MPDTIRVLVDADAGCVVIETWTEAGQRTACVRIDPIAARALAARIERHAAAASRGQVRASDGASTTEGQR